MRTDAQIEASRANGRRSHGPITEEGKASSSRNATTHGLLSNTAILPGENDAEFERRLAAAVELYQPSNDEEMSLVEEYTMYKWRQVRLWCLHTAGLAGELANQTGEAPELLDRDIPYRTYTAYQKSHLLGSNFPLMHRYEVCYANQYHRARRELRKLMAEKLARQKVEDSCPFPIEPRNQFPELG